MHFRVVLVAATASAAAAAACDEYWFEHVQHGWSYRNVTAFGARGDGVADDTKAIQAAIDYERGGDAGSGADKSAAFVYIPAGRYKVTDTLVLWKWTSLQGNALCPPTLLLPAGTALFDGTAGLRPLVVTNGGFNSTAADHAWWLEGDSVGGATNVYFFSSIRSVNVVIEEGNPGAVGITWNVAQQTVLRNVSISAARDTAIALDVGAGPDYVHWNSGVPYTLGGGGTVEDVSVTGARTGVRVGATQFALRGLSINGSTEVALRLWQLTWSIAFLQLAIADTPLAVRLEGVAGGVYFLDVSMQGITGDAAVSMDATTAAGAPIVLQNVALSGSTPWVVQGLLPAANASAGGLTVVDAWAAGAAYGADGAPRAAAAGALPLPTLADAAAAGVPLACIGVGGAPHLCGGSDADASTGIPSRPRPAFGEPGTRVLSAFDYGVVGDGTTDCTVALRAALAALATAGPRSTLFLPFGIYLVNDTLVVPPGGRLVGEGLSVILLAPLAPGFGPPPPGGNLKPLLLVAGGDAEIADISVWNTGCGNDGAALLVWEGASGSGLWDFNILASAAVGAKAVVIGGGYFANTWLAAATAYDPTAPAVAMAAASGDGGGAAAASRSQYRRRALDLGALQAPLLITAAAANAAYQPWRHAAAPSADVAMLAAASSHAAVAEWRARTAPLLLPVLSARPPPPPQPHAGASACLFTTLGELVGTGGPFFWVGANLEHATGVELALLPGAINAVVVSLETEESTVGLSLNATANAVVFGTLHAFWNASLHVAAEVLLSRGGGGGAPPPFDLAYRIMGLGVPLPGSESALALDITPNGRGFAVPLASDATGYARAAALLLAPQPWAAAAAAPRP